MFAGRMAAAARRFPRRVPLEPRFAELLPEVLFAIGPQEFAALAARALAPKAPPTVSVDHIHAPFVSIREQAVLIAGRLRGLGRASLPAAVGGRDGATTRSSRRSSRCSSCTARTWWRSSRSHRSASCT